MVAFFTSQATPIVRTQVRARNQERLTKNKTIDSIELRNVLEKYVKAKLPTYLCQKNVCLYIPASNCTEDIDVPSKSFDIQHKFIDDELSKSNKLNRTYI